MLLFVIALTSVATGFAASPKKIALVQTNQEALFFTQMNDGARKAAKAAGIDLTIFNSNNSASEQNNAIEAYINQRFDAILVNAIDRNSVLPAVTASEKAGIPVVAIDSILHGDNSGQVGVDNRQAGVDIGKYTADYIRTKLGGKAKIGVVAALSSDVQNLRLDGFKSAFATMPGVKIVSIVDGQNVQDQAQSAAENLITGNPDLQIIYATGEPALIGVVAAAGAQEATERIKVVGWDLSAQAIRGIDQGFVLVVVQQDPESEGAIAVDTAIKLMSKQKVEKSIAVPVTLVTKANVDKYRAVFK